MQICSSHDGRIHAKNPRAAGCIAGISFIMIDNMNIIVSVFALLLLMVLTACTPPQKNIGVPPLQVVSAVDLQRYAGTWYEIAHYPNSFQRGCVATTANYAALLTGKIRVVNTCRKERLDGDIISAEGKAWVVDPKTNAKLKVSFFWPFSGDYWIIELGENYDYAVVGHPDRKYLWILSRTPFMDSARYADILSRLQKTHSYDTRKLVRTLQPD
ncbi:MAG: outer membrane lipoprotein Blc [Nitrospirae bacterium]|nr:MAG: outer membrane lipoprotein Blc [Nitrospirota bacterium]